MKKTFTIVDLLVLLAAVLVLGYSSMAFSGEPGVTEKYKNAKVPFDAAAVDVIQDLPKNTVTVRQRYRGGLFRTETRKDKIARFKCSQCHNDKPVTVHQAAEIAHGRVVLDHGSTEKPLDCYTCHDREDRDQLVTEGGQRVDMDHSYQLCGQCHFRQKKDWVGGAHGKRIGYWAGARVVKTCASCHDPHSPHFKKRWPVTYSSPNAK
ncbi:MAG: cytochrome c3 family protein [Desulfobacteraceae bacterium]|jgi:hypothetical protein